MPTRSRIAKTELKHLRCLYAVPSAEYSKIKRIQKFMKNPVKNDLHKNPQFFQDTIYMIDQFLALSFESSGFATYEGVMDPATTVDGIPTVQPVLEQKIRQAIEGIQALQTIHSVDIQTCFKSYIGFEQSLRDAGIVVGGHIVSMKNFLNEEVDHVSISLAPNDSARKLWTVQSSVFKAAHQVLKVLYGRSQQDVQIRFSAQDFLSFHIKSSEKYPESSLYIMCFPSDQKKIKLSA